MTTEPWTPKGPRQWLLYTSVALLLVVVLIYLIPVRMGYGMLACFEQATPEVTATFNTVGSCELTKVVNTELDPQ